MLFAKESQDQGRTEVSKEKGHYVGSEAREHRHLDSTNSDNSSNNVSRKTSVTSKTGYRTSMELAPVPLSPLHSEPKSMPSTESSEACRVPPEVITPTLLHGGEDNGSELAVIPASPEEIRRPLSPRREIEIFQATNPSRSKTVYSSPLERFLAQESGPTDYDSDPQRLEEGWGRLRNLRASTLRLRGQLRQLRKELHRREFAKSSADDLFMKHVRELRSASISHLNQDIFKSEDTILEAQYAAIQAARDDYGPIFDDYNNMEDLLDQQEFEMAKIESRLYHPTIDETLPSGPSLIGLSSESPPKLHPLHISYLSRLGDLDLVRERLQNMIQERDSILYDQESRLRVGMNVHENEQNFLDQFPLQEAALLGELVAIEQDIERLKEACLEEGIELAESSLGDIDGSEVEDISIKSQSDHASIGPSTFSLLLPKSDEKKVKLGVFITDFDEGNKNDRINRWLRYQLQTSPLEVELLVRIFQHLLEVVDLRQWRKGIFYWQVSVTFWWEHDDANRQLEAFKPPDTLNTISQSLSSVVNDIYDKSEKTMKVSNESSRPVRRIRSAPCSLDLGRLFNKEEFSRATTLLISH
jgi:hypothetical protein